MWGAHDLRAQAAALPHPARRRPSTRHARKVTLHLPADWPWAGALMRAFKRIEALPGYG
jgi:hypothetical protein